MLAVAACGGDDGGADGEEATDSTTPSTTSAPTTTLDPRDEVEASYLAYWDAFHKASMDPVDPQLPELQARMTGDQSRATTRNLQNMQATGLAVKRPDGARHTHAVIDVGIEGNEAIVHACSIDDLVTYEIATGRPTDDSIATKRYEATLVRESGEWKVRLVTETERVEGIVPCPG